MSIRTFLQQFILQHITCGSPIPEGSYPPGNVTSHIPYQKQGTFLSRWIVPFFDEVGDVSSLPGGVPRFLNSFAAEKTNRSTKSTAFRWNSWADIFCLWRATRGLRFGHPKQKKHGLKWVRNVFFDVFCCWLQVDKFGHPGELFNQPAASIRSVGSGLIGKCFCLRGHILKDVP